MASDAAVLKLSATNANSAVRTHLLTARCALKTPEGFGTAKKCPILINIATNN